MKRMLLYYKRPQGGVVRQGRIIIKLRSLGSANEVKQNGLIGSNKMKKNVMKKYFNKKHTIEHKHFSVLKSTTF